MGGSGECSAFGARLVQEGTAHGVADQASFDGQFCDADQRHLDQASRY
ncbi:type IV toxin-antitoxin system YeeU family antitoxin [Klebsiella quasipneumoniae]